MKNINLFVLVALVGFSSVVTAFDTDLDSIGIGVNCRNAVGATWSEYSSPNRLSCNDITDETSRIYFMLPFAGDGVITLNVGCKLGSIGCNITCESINYSASTNVETTSISNDTWFINGSGSTITIYYNSNIGLIGCYNQKTGTGDLAFNITKSGSGVTYGSNRYYPTYQAGTHLPMHSVNMFYNLTCTPTPQSTYALNPVTNVMEMTSRNASALPGLTGKNYNIFRPSCSLSGLQNYWFNNWEGGTGTGVNTYYQTLNITPYGGNNITGFTYANNSTQSFSEGTTLNLSVVASNPSAVDAIVWYKDGNETAGIGRSNYSIQLRLTARNEPYYIEVQLEDNDCGLYPTVGFYVYIGKSISLSGTISERDSSGVVSPLAGASVSLSGNVQGSWIATTDSAGWYYFSGMPPETYFFVAEKTGYTSFNTSLALDYGSSSWTSYDQDATLNRTQTYNSRTILVFDETDQDNIIDLNLVDLNLRWFWDGAKVLEINNGSIIYKKYNSSAMNLFNASFNINDNSISLTRIPDNEEYTFAISKVGYTDMLGQIISWNAETVSSGENPAAKTIPIYFTKNTSQDAFSGATRLSISFAQNVSANQCYILQASYTFDSQPINGAACEVDSSAFTDTYTLSQSGSDSSYYATVCIDNATSGTYNLGVFCQKTGYEGLYNVRSFKVVGGAELSYIYWNSYPSSVESGESTTFSLVYEDSQGNPINDGSCNLTINGTKYSMTNFNRFGYYKLSFVPNNTGSYSFNATCQKAGFLAALSSNLRFSVYEGVPPIVDHCFNDRRDMDETDVDCGGSCSDCELGLRCLEDWDCRTGYCQGNICSVSHCNDGIKNGGEDGVDCGGLCDACLCFTAWDCVDDGSQKCVSNECTLESCVGSCSPIIWYDPRWGYYSRDRFCIDGRCLFNDPSSQNISVSTSIVIVPYTEFYFNNSGTTFYVSNCEEGTNGARVITPQITKKAYYYSASGLSPSVPDSGNIVFGDGAYLKETAGLLPALCEIPVGSSNTSALVTFQAIGGGSTPVQRSIYLLNFKRAFRANATRTSMSVVSVNLTRPGFCFYRSDTASNWTVINVAAAINIALAYNSSDGGVYVLCNTTYGEESEARVGPGVAGIVSMSFTFAGLLFNAFWLAIVGSDFAWEAWMIIPIVFCVAILFPAMVLLLIQLKRGPDRR